MKNKYLAFIICTLLIPNISNADAHKRKQSKIGVGGTVSDTSVQNKTNGQYDGTYKQKTESGLSFQYDRDSLSIGNVRKWKLAGMEFNGARIVEFENQIGFEIGNYEQYRKPYGVGYQAPIDENRAQYTAFEGETRLGVGFSSGNTGDNLYGMGVGQIKFRGEAPLGENSDQRNSFLLNRNTITVATGVEGGLLVSSNYGDLMVGLAPLLSLGEHGDGNIAEVAVAGRVKGKKDELRLSIEALRSLVGNNAGQRDEVNLNLSLMLSQSTGIAGDAFINNTKAKVDPIDHGLQAGADVVRVGQSAGGTVRVFTAW